MVPVPGSDCFVWLRHAYVGRDSKSPPNVLDTEWVAIYREPEFDGPANYCVEHLDARFGEIAGENPFPTESDAQTYAERLYGLRPQDWRDGEPRTAQQRR